MVYFIQNDTTKNIKIGYSSNVELRLASFLGANDAKLVLLAVMKGGRKKEKYLHNLFDEFRIRNEWFSPSPEILSFIQDVIDGSTQEDIKQWSNATKRKNKNSIYAIRRVQVALRPSLDKERIKFFEKMPGNDTDKFRTLIDFYSKVEKCPKDMNVMLDKIYSFLLQEGQSLRRETIQLDSPQDEEIQALMEMKKAGMIGD